MRIGPQFIKLKNSGAFLDKDSMQQLQLAKEFDALPCIRSSMASSFSELSKAKAI
jgi:hypothetical protein